MNAITKKWIEAGRVLSEDPSAVVRCPVRNDGVLLVHHEPLPDGSGIERYLVCESCGARSVMLMRRSQISN
jgi:hypothetical protein